MTSTVFVNGVTLTDADWFNDVDSDTYETGNVVNVTVHGAIPDGSTNNTSAFAAAVAAVPSGGSLRFAPTAAGATYVGVISVRRDDITLIFDGVTIKHPAGAPAAAVLELGDLSSGNGAIAYSRINIKGNVLLDGNKANVTAPSDDLTAWGFAATKISNSDFGDGVRAKDCHNGGVGIFINSNYNKGSFYVESCGNVTHTGPGFDINSSKYGDYSFISNGCYDGGRVLDNCWNLNVRGTVFNATSAGFIYNNQSTNESYNNNLDIDVYTCGSNGFTVGLNCRTSNIRANIYDAAGVGMTFTNDVNHSSNLNIDLTTRNGDLQGLLLYGDDCIIRHQSYLDGRAGAVGAVFAVDVNGNRNKLSVDLIDSSSWQVRGIAFRSGATDNELVAYSYTNTLDPLNDAGTRTKIHAAGTGATVTAANSITLPPLGLIVPITGSTGIATIGASRKGLYILTFDGTLTVLDGSNLKLSGNFSATADDTLTIYHDGTSAYEVARSNN